jgi:hypothetical protein
VLALRPRWHPASCLHNTMARLVKMERDTISYAVLPPSVLAKGSRW